MTFGERLTELRRENGYNSREKLAKALGIPSTTLRNYEKNTREPGHKFLRDVSKFFNVSVDYLLCLTDTREINATNTFNQQEDTLIKKYRKLDNFGKKAVNSILTIEYDRCIQDNKPVVIDIDGLKESIYITDAITDRIRKDRKREIKKK